MRAELLPDAYSPFRLETEVVLMPVLLILRRRLAMVRAVYHALEDRHLAGQRSAHPGGPLHLDGYLRSLATAAVTPLQTAEKPQSYCRLSANPLTSG